MRKIKIVADSSADVLRLEPMDKCRGEARSLEKILAHLEVFGLCRGKVRIDHCRNQGAADRLKERILARFSQVDVKIGQCRGLCSFYAEKGGLLVGFEKM